MIGRIGGFVPVGLRNMIGRNPVAQSIGRTFVKPRETVSFELDGTTHTLQKGVDLQGLFPSNTNLFESLGAEVFGGPDVRGTQKVIDFTPEQNRFYREVVKATAHLLNPPKTIGETSFETLNLRIGDKTLLVGIIKQLTEQTKGFNGRKPAERSFYFMANPSFRDSSVKVERFGHFLKQQMETKRADGKFFLDGETPQKAREHFREFISLACAKAKEIQNS